MTLPAYPTTRQSAKKYAAELSKETNKKWLPIERIRPLKNKWTPDFAAIEENEPMIAGWREIK